jgi:hypothetical protein
MAKDAKSWKLEIDEFMEEEVVGRAVEVQQTIMMDALGKVVVKTPVGNRRRWKRNIERAQRGLPPLPKGYVGGHARKNWQITINRRPTNEVQGTDAGGNDTVSKGMQRVRQIDEPCIAYLSNLLPYMDRLEGGWSKSARNGIVGPTVRELLQKYRRIR